MKPERRKQAKIEARLAAEQGRTRGRWVKISAVALTLGVSGGVTGYVWHVMRPPGASRGVAGVTPPSGVAAPSGKTFEEATNELKKKDDFQKKSKEWVWAEEGRTEKVIQAYREIKRGGSQAHEDRTRILNTLARNVKERKDWPPEFSDAKAKEVMAFLAEILGQKPEAGSEPVAAAHTVLSYGEKIPELHRQAEAILLKYYDLDDRIGPRGATLDLLAQLHCAKALPRVRQAMLSADFSTSRSGAYSLAYYLDSPQRAEARQALIGGLKKKPELRPLVAKLLAYHGQKQAADLVPGLLSAHAEAADIEAGAYVIEKLRLKKYVGLLNQYSAQNGTVFLQQQVDAARKAAQ